MTDALRWSAVVLGVAGVAAGLWLLQSRPSMPGTVWVWSRSRGAMVSYANWVIFAGGLLALVGWRGSPTVVLYVFGAVAVFTVIMLTYTFVKAGPPGRSR